jgi:hypothetical protein
MIYENSGENEDGKSFDREGGGGVSPPPFEEKTVAILEHKDFMTFMKLGVSVLLTYIICLNNRKKLIKKVIGRKLLRI